MFQAYRVLQPFWWRGWHYGPEHIHASVNPETGKREPCNCPHYAGDVWIVEAGHPRKDSILFMRVATGDASLQPAEELLKEERFSRLLQEPNKTPKPEPVGVGRPRGRK